MLHAGDAAPEFSVPDHLGRTVSLADFRARTLVIWFYPVADTPG